MNALPHSTLTEALDCPVCVCQLLDAAAEDDKPILFTPTTGTPRFMLASVGLWIGVPAVCWVVVALVLLRVSG